MKQPRITFLTDRMIKGHGVDLVVDRIAHGLARKGYFTEVYANTVDETFTSRKSYRIYTLPPLGAGNFFMLERRARKLAGFLNSRDTDLYVIQSFPFYSLIPRLKKPAIVVDHGIIETVGLPFKRRLFFKYQRISQNLSYYRKAKRVVCVSEYLLRQLPDYIKRKATVIYNGIDHYSSARFSKEERENFRDDLNIDDDDVLMLYVGRLNLTNQPYKGLAELADIYQQVSLKNNKIKLLAVGYGTRNDSELLKNHGVLCLANVPENDMPIIYQSTDIYTTCSRWEGFDLPIGEAQYFGKPAICYNIGAHPEVLVNGKTGFIVNNKEEFKQKIEILSENSPQRKKIGENAKEFVKRFYWQNAIDRYDREVRKILNISPEKDLKESIEFEKSVQKEEGKKRIYPGQITEEEASKTIAIIENQLYKKVTVLIINYNSSFHCMKECIDSLRQQTYKNMEIMIFDNGSSNDVLDLVEKKYKDIKIIRSDENLGLGEAVNQSLKHIESTYILVSNFDVVYDKIALEEFVETIITLDNRYVGLAPKIKFFYQKDYIESAGTYVDSNFYLGYNGLGQLDLDQYNKQEDVFGLSFTSAFLRRDYLDQSIMGPIDKPIDPGYFLFYEDIDFCYRSNLLGYRFRSCPTAVCYHKYAYSFRDEATAFITKYYYQKLNVMRLVYKNTETGNMKRVIKNETGIQCQNLNDRNLKGVARKILRDWRRSRYGLKKQRNYIQIIRQLPDSEIIKFSWGEKNYFDVVNNEPIYCIQNLLLTYKRLFVITGNRKYEEYIQYLESFDDTRYKIQVEYLRNFLNGKLEYEPAPIHDFINRIC
jgi:GT2 family glycosyltransferase/glycosyltransferase involved in cell wall biosynthesis